MQEADDANKSARSDPGHVEHRTEARRAYGLDPATYNAGRPDYPDQVYCVLEERCGLRPGIAVLESGPGSGQVTRHLVDAGAHVTAVEPDPAMGEFLRKSLPQGAIEVIESTFEDAPLGDESFDLVVAATSFHWVDPSMGLPKIGRVVRSEGWVALWWTHFEHDVDSMEDDVTVEGACSELQGGFELVEMPAQAVLCPGALVDQVFSVIG
jgi:SAM-dependent methyltransferase